MAYLTRYEWAFGFTPGGITRLCSDLPIAARLAVLNELDRNWNETKPFEVDVKILLEEHPHVHVLTVAVDPVTQQVTIERRIGNVRFASCPDCRLGRC